jgi:murein DD-endopeptidase MepM/ murein hydrolase activator NlpD
MAGITPDTLRKAADIKSTISTPTAEGVKGTTVEVAKGAAAGAVTGGWVGAARGAAVSFAKTKAGRRIIAGVLCLAVFNMLAIPFTVMLGLNAITSAAAYGNDYRAGESAMSAGNEQAEVTDAMAVARNHDIQWPLYLALTTVQDETEIDADKLATNLNATGAKTLAAAGVYVSGKGMVEGETEREKALAQTEKTAYVTALTAYGLDEPAATKVYATALKWAYGAQESCTTSETATADEAEAGSPIQLEDGTSVTLTDVQLGNAQKIIGYASKIEGMTPDAIIISLMAAMTESGLQNYANKNVPASLTYPHDAVGEDHDSVGFWQMRQHWGTTAQLMDIEYQTSAFFGGPNGPNGGSPRGLFDIPNWETKTKGEAAQAVEVSAFPDRYQKHEPLAKALLARFGEGMTFCDGGLGVAGEAGYPMGDASFKVTSGYGLRVPGAGSSNHKGIDFGASCGLPIYAFQDGKVIHSGSEGGWGNTVVIEHAGGLVTRSAHMPNGGTRAAEGSMVKKGEQIGTVGNTGNSGGCHLHFETLLDKQYMDPAQIMTEMGLPLNFWSCSANGRPPGIPCS